MAPKYGAVDGPTVGKSSLGNQGEPVEWESYGSASALLIDVASSSGYYFVLLVCVFLSMRAGEDNYVTSGCDGEGLGLFTVYACEYTKAYVRCFPELALSILLLFIFRNISSKRIYYYMLKVGGVIDFRTRQAWRDPLVQLLTFCWLHCLGHAAIAFSLAEINENHLVNVAEQIVSPRPGHASTDKETANSNVLVFIDLMAFLVLPCTLFLVFLYLSYDIEKSLIPLSQYVHSMAPSSNADTGKLELSVLRDDVAKVILEEHQSDIRGKRRSGMEGDCIELIRIYKQEWRRWGNQAPCPPLVSLFSSMWPARLQLVQRSEPGWKRFAALWFGLLIPSLLLLISVEWFLGNRVWMDLVAIKAGKNSAIVEMTIEAAHFIVVALIFGKLVQTIAWVQGSDQTESTPRKSCHSCSGTGQSRGWLGQNQACPKCNGTGSIVDADDEAP